MQPSGTDYIIHVLGDKQRQEYVRKFIEYDAEVVCTPFHRYYNDWLIFGNWFFYKHLYQSYRPVLTTPGYTLYQKKSDTSSSVKTPTQISCKIIEDGRVLLSLDYDEPVCGIADAVIDVEARYKPTSCSIFNCPPIIKVSMPEDEGGKFLHNLPGKWKGEIAIPVVYGHGSIVLSSYSDMKEVEIKVKHMASHRIIRTPTEYIDLRTASEITASGDETRMRIPDPFHLINESAAMMKIGEHEIPIRVCQRDRGTVGIILPIDKDTLKLYMAENAIGTMMY